MSLISNVGRKKGKGLLVIILFYIILLIGAVTMVIPFLMTLNTSVTNQYDSGRFSLYPRFVFNENELFCKYLFLKYFASPADYNYLSNQYKIQRAQTMADFTKVRDPLKNIFAPLDYYNWEPEKLQTAWNDWEEYWAQLKKTDIEQVALPVTILYLPINRIGFQDFIKNRYMTLWAEQNPQLAKTLSKSEKEKGALALMNSSYGRTVATSFHRLSLTRGDTEFGRTAKMGLTPRTRDYEEFIRTLPAGQVTIQKDYFGAGTTDWGFMSFARNKYINLEGINNAWGTDYEHLGEIIFSENIPENPVVRQDRDEYLKKDFPLMYVQIARPVSNEKFRQWLLKRHQNNLQSLNRNLDTSFASMEEIVFTDQLPEQRLLRVEWGEFIAENVPVEDWIITRPDKGYREFLRAKYNTLENLNQAYGQSYTSFETVALPQPAFDRADFLERKWELLYYFLTNNFIQVFKFIAIQGNAMWNTLILVGAFLIAGLTVNPLAAYALSRYKIKFKEVILIMFLIPMAFPGEVMQIPGFILTRDLGLLNTYWALILPGLANGFGIFLMKGFFDGLPRELYEAAELDGANEWQIYWTVTFPMCKPIIALQMMGTIIMAYSEYMWAFIVCPDERKWTLAVWIFQYSMEAMQRGESHLQMAALVLMSIPTLFVFIIMQKIIMKGIILPSMK